MNAMIREEHEVPVESKDVNELRADIRELRAADAVLAMKVDALGAKVDALAEKVQAVNITLREKIETVHNTLRDKIDSVHTTLRDKMDEGFRASDEKLAKMSESVAKLHGSQKAILWAIGTFGGLETFFTVGKALHWF